MASPLTIAGIVTEGLDRAFLRLRSLLAIYWLPWVIGSAAIFIVDILYEDQWQLGYAPAWVRNLVWGPCIAMANVMLVRLLVFGQPPRRAINLEFSRETAWAAVLVTLWFLATVAVKKAPAWVSFRLAWYLVHYRLEEQYQDLYIYLALFGWAAWIVTALLPLCFFGLIVLTVKLGRPDLREHIRLLRADPLRLIVIAILVAAASHSLSSADARFWEWAGAPLQAPLLHPWHVYLREAVLFRLSEFPLRFMAFVLETCLLAEAYRRLLQAEEPGVTAPSFPGSQIADLGKSSPDS